MKLHKIKVKFFLFIIAVLIPVIIFEVISISNDKEQIIKSKLDSSVYLSGAISNFFIEYIDNVWTQEDIISTYMMNNPDLTVEQISSYLKQVKDKQETVQNLFWLDEDGIVIAGSDSDMIGRSLRYSEYVARIREGEDRVLSDLTNGFTDDSSILPIAKAIKEDGKLKYIMVACINAEKMGSIFSSLLFDEGDIFTLVDKKGTIVYCDDAPNIYKNRIKIAADSPTWGALAGAVIRTKKKLFENQGLHRLGCSYPIGNTGWALSVIAKYNDVIRIVHKETMETAALFEIILFISFIMAFLAGDYFITPMIKLKNAAYDITHGNLSVRTNIKGNDEIALTAQTFDSMAESIEQNDKQKSKFFANISHELKTPLNVILASLQLIDKVHADSKYCPKYPKINEQLFLIRQNCYSLVRMVSNLIDLSKHENGYLKLKLGNYNIIGIIEDVTMSIVGYAEIKNLEILFDTDIEEKIMACSPDAIERIMLNLISNALKFTEEGGSIFINIFDKGDSVLISVKDTGIGIPEDSLDSIFERFKQVDSSIGRNNEGSGIGLSLVKALVEAHGGNIKVNSILNEGSEFIIELPVVLLKETDGNVENDKLEAIHNKIAEKINLEFSDIYSLRNASK